MNRSRARASSVLAAVALLLALVPAYPARAQGRVPTFWFAGTRLIFERAAALDGDVAVAVRDAGLARFLARLGATASYQPQQRYVVVTAADRRTIVFTIGTAQYTAAGVAARAAFAPFLDGGDAVLPLYALARALYVEPVPDAGDTVLQPQIGALDITSDGGRTVVTVRGATSLAYVRRVETPEHLELAFIGIGSTLAGTRPAGTGTLTVVTGGAPRSPATVVTLDFPRGATHESLVPASPYEVGVAFTPAGAVAAASPVASATPASTAGGATPGPGEPADAAVPAPTPGVRPVVTAVALAPSADGLQIHIAVTGAAVYEWHRLADQRWYVDIKGATLTDAGRDEHPPVAAVESVRIRQTGTVDAPFVRVAMTLRGDRRVDVAANSEGLSVEVVNADAGGGARIGTGRVGVAVAVPDVTPVPPDPGSYVPPGAVLGPPVPGSRIIVIDPGHGGGDQGTAHNGLVEKTITLDIARRLRTMLLAAGWTVRMTRDADVDPVTPENLAAMRADGKPNADDRAYLQTRCDVANNAGARMFISIHVNYSANPDVNGSTFYWYKPQDLAFAKALERSVIAAANTNDLGARHDNLYVIRHTTMPAVLVETAFISNPGDAHLLGSPPFLNAVAQGIANGVKAFAGAPAASSQDDQ